jgi:predicted DNA-binding transcriptional regulator YafY
MLEASVTVNRDLLTELHDLGAHLEVLEPASVRDHLARLATQLHRIYCTTEPDVRNPK